MVARTLVTAQELADLPADGPRFELIDGEVQAMSPANPDHGWIGLEFCRLIGNHVVEHGLGEMFGSDTGYLLAHDPDTVLSPDGSFIRSDRLPPAETWGSFFPFGPDIAIEVLSPSNTSAEMRRKTIRYFAAGTQLVIIVDPKARTVRISRPGHGDVAYERDDVLDLSPALPGFTLPLRSIFRRLI
jgi:Uma2 family endonuclease